MISNIYLCPFCIHYFITKFNDKQFVLRLIKGCFFEPLILFPELYQIVDPWIIISEVENEKVTNILKDIIDDDLIGKTIDIICNPNIFKKKVFPFENNRDVIHHNKIIDNIDQIIINHVVQILLYKDETSIIDKIKNEKLNDYKLFRFLFTKEFINKKSKNNQSKREKIYDIIKDICLSGASDNEQIDATKPDGTFVYDSMNNFDYVEYTFPLRKICKFVTDGDYFSEYSEPQIKLYKEIFEITKEEVADVSYIEEEMVSELAKSNLH